MPLEQLTRTTWGSAESRARTQWIEEAAKRVGGTAHSAAIEMRGVRLALIPGGTFQLGWDGKTTALDSERRARWEAAAGSRSTFEEFLRYYLGPARTVSVPSFLIEASAISISDLGVDSYGEDPETALRAVIEENGFRLPTNDEWEVAMRAGVSTLFAWGDTWPDGAGPTYAIKLAARARSMRT